MLMLLIGFLGIFWYCLFDLCSQMVLIVIYLCGSVSCKLATGDQLLKFLPCFLAVMNARSQVHLAKYGSLHLMGLDLNMGCAHFDSIVTFGGMGPIQFLNQIYIIVPIHPESFADCIISTTRPVTLILFLF